MYKYNPAVKRALELVDTGKLGDINYVEAHMSSHYYKYSLDFLSTLPGGMMLYLGCHLTDLIFRIMGAPKKVIPHNFSTGSWDTTAIDTGFVLYEYDCGTSFVKASASEVNDDSHRQLIISGTLGTVEIMPFENPMEALSIVCPQDVSCKISYRNAFNGIRNFNARSEFIHFPLFGRYDDMMLDFANKLNCKIETVYTYEYERKLHRLLRKSIL